MKIIIVHKTNNPINIIFILALKCAHTLLMIYSLEVVLGYKSLLYGEK